MVKFNIFFILPKLYPCDVGGLEVFYFHLIKNLENHYLIDLFTNCEFWLLNNKSTQLRIHNSYKSSTGPLINYFNIFYSLIICRHSNLVFIPYTSNSSLIYPFLLFNMVFKIPYVISIHGGGLYNWKPAFIHKYFFMKADYIIAASMKIKEEYEFRTKREIRYIPPVTPFKSSNIEKNDLKGQYPIVNSDNIILSVGSIKKIKGSDLLVESFIQLGKEFICKNNLKLLFAGDGPMKGQLKLKIHDLGFNDYVKFLGNIPNENLHELYEIADFYVIPSFFEGTPKSLLEAMFNGLPIVGSDTVGINNIITNNKNGLLFENKNPSDLKEKIKKIVENKELALKLGSKAKVDYLSHYNFDKVVCDHKNIFNYICSDFNE